MDLNTLQLNGERIKKRADQSKEQYELDNKEFNEIQSREFSLFRDTLILSGTIFGSSIALSTGKLQNSFFYLGEVFLFLSILCSSISLWSKVRGDYWFHFLMLRSRAQLDLNLNSDIMEDFEKNAIKDQVTNYEKLLKLNPVFNLLFRIIKIDWFQSGGTFFAIIGAFLLLLSLFNVHFKLSVPSFSISL